MSSGKNQKFLHLGINTSFFSTEVTIFSAEEILARCLQDGIGSAEVLNKLVSEALGEAEAGFEDLSSIYAISGPGSFTGLRVGVSAAQAFSLALKVPIFAVSSLFALACSSEIEAKEFTVFLEASRNDYFCSSFKRNDLGVMQALGPVKVVEKSSAQEAENALVVESGRGALIDWLKTALQCEKAAQEENFKHIQRSKNGIGLEILYGKGTSAKTLRERGIKLTEVQGRINPASGV
jgi:tRNA threonylcarbamoyladenosine biosynthesis protein TsaB